MRLLLEQKARRFHVQTLERAPEFSAPFGDQPYPCLIWDHEGRTRPEERKSVAEALIRSGCRYAVCAGIECETWHDEIDRAFVWGYLDLPEAILDQRRVMTTWHDGEAAEEVAFFFVWNTNFDDHDFARFLVLHIGGDANERRLVEDSVCRATLDAR